MRRCRRWRAPGPCWPAAPISIRRGSAGRSTRTSSTSAASPPARHTAGPDGWRLGATTTWSELLESRAAAPVRRAEAGGARGRRPADPECRNDRRKSVQCLARGRRRAAAAGARRRGRAGGTGRHAAPAVRVLHHRQPPHRAGARRAAGRHPCSQARARRPQRIPQARRATLSRDLHRHGGGHARNRATAGSPTRASPSAPARRWRSGCRRWKRRLSARTGRGARRARRGLASRAAVADRRCARQRRLSARCRRHAAAPPAARALRHEGRLHPERPARGVERSAGHASGRRRCATISASPAPRSAATPATAAPARCGSTAGRSAPASWRWARWPAARSRRSRAWPAPNGTLAALQKSFLDHGAAQCGICTPGMLMAAQDLLANGHAPSRAEIEDALGGVLCRCTGYSKIVDAVMACAPAPPAAAARRRGGRRAPAAARRRGQGHRPRPVRRRRRAGRRAVDPGRALAARPGALHRRRPRRRCARGSRRC